MKRSGMRNTLDALVGLLAWCVVGALLLVMATGCLAFAVVLCLCAWRFFDGGWVLLAMFSGTAALGVVVDWAFKRVMKANAGIKFPERSGGKLQ